MIAIHEPDLPGGGVAPTPRSTPPKVKRPMPVQDAFLVVETECYSCGGDQILVNDYDDEVFKGVCQRCGAKKQMKPARMTPFCVGLHDYLINEAGLMGLA